MAENTQRLPGKQVIYLTNVAAAADDDTCGMRYWFSNLEGGTGVTKRDTIVAQLLDREIHADLAQIAQLPDISPAAIQLLVDNAVAHLTPRDKLDTKCMELLYRRLGWMVAFALYQEPKVRDSYRTLPIEPKLLLDKENLHVEVYPDRLLKHKTSGEVVYREYVPMQAGLTQERWQQGWHYNIRLHVGIAAATGAADPTLHPTYGEVIGLSRGYRSVIDGRLVHPYVWGWKSATNAEWTHNTSGRAGNWTSCPVWEFPAGLVAWVQMCGEGVAKSQFPSSPPVYFNQRFLNDWIARRLHREREIAGIRSGALVNHYLRSIYFGKVTTACYPAQGDLCPFLYACWNQPTPLTPPSKELYAPALESL